MARVAGARSVRALADIVGRGIPVIGQGIEIGHFDTCLLKRVPHGRNQAQGGHFPFFTGIQAQVEPGLGY